MKSLNPRRVAVAALVMLLGFVLLLLLADEAGAQGAVEGTGSTEATIEEPPEAAAPAPAAEPLEPAEGEASDDLPALFIDLPRMVDDSGSYHLEETVRDLHQGDQPENIPTKVADGSDEPDIGCGAGCHRSQITQKLLDRWWTGTQWAVVIEATLDSNRFCHLLWYHCVVSPAQPLTTDLVLFDIECLSPHWLDYGDRCVKRGHLAGQDQKFNFTFLVDPSVISGSVFETVEFWRPMFPCWCKQILASDTIEVDFDVELEIVKDCPDTVQAGTASFQCNITVFYPDPTGQATPDGPIISPGPSLSAIAVEDFTPAAFTPAGLSFLSGSGTWNCPGTHLCSDGELDPGQEAVFLLTTGVDPAADGVVTNTAEVRWNVGNPPFSDSDSDDIDIYRPSDTKIAINKDRDELVVLPGQPISWHVTITNTGGGAGTNLALNVRVSDSPPSFIEGAELTYESGVGTWSCSGLLCTTPVMPVGTTVFKVSGTVSAGTSTPSFVHNEAQVEWDNNIFGPDFPETAGSTTVVLSNSIERQPAAPEPASSAGETEGQALAVTGSGLTLPLSLLGLLFLAVGFAVRRASMLLP